MLERQPLEGRNIVQANPLIESRKNMTLAEQRLFGLGVQAVTPFVKDGIEHDEKFPLVIIPHSELERLFAAADPEPPQDGKVKRYASNIETLKRQVKKAFDGKIELTTKNGGFELYHIYQKMLYEPGKGLIIKFDDEMRPFLLDLLSKKYTKYPLITMFQLQSEYALRIFELMMEYKGFLKNNEEIYREFSIEEIRFYLNVPEGKYKGRMDNFLEFTIKKPLAEINKRTAYNMRYESLKQGVKVVGIKLFLQTKDVEVQDYTPKFETGDPEEFALIRGMASMGLAKNRINAWLKKYGKDKTKKLFEMAVKHSANSNIKTSERAAYIAACLDKDIITQNQKEAATKKEIDEREKRLAAEKEMHNRQLDNISKVMTERTSKIAAGEWWIKYPKAQMIKARMAYNNGLTEAEFCEKYNIEQAEIQTVQSMVESIAQKLSM